VLARSAMSLSLYDLSVPVFERHLRALKSQLARGQAYADERKFDSAKFVDTKLAPDMLPFSVQIRIACDFAKNGAGRLAGVERTAFTGADQSFADFEARIDDALSFVGGLDRAKFDGAEARDVTFPAGPQEMTLSGLDYLRGYVLPNFFFHCTTAYALLRHGGVQLGKRDFLGL
jgi:hypothetical protein